MKTRNKILLIVGLFLLAFIIAMCVIFCVIRSVPDTLIQCVLGTGGVVELLTGAITIAEMVCGKEKKIK